MSALAEEVGATALVIAEAYGESDVSAIVERVHAVVAARVGLGSVDDGVIESLLRSWSDQLGKRIDSLENNREALDDLGRWLGGDRGRVAIKFRRGAQWFLDHYVPLTGLLALLATAFYGAAYARFYNALDISPGDAGIDTTEILTRSLVGGVVFCVAVAGILVGLFAPLSLAVDSRQARHLRKGTWSDWCALVVCAVATPLGLVWLAHGKPYESFMYPSLLLPVCAAVAALRRHEDGGVKLSVRPIRVRGNELLGLFLASYMVALLALFLVVSIKASARAQQANDGEAVRPPTFLGLPYVGIRAEPTFVRWRHSKPLIDLPRCVLYLGRSDGLDVLFDPVGTRTIRVPDTELLLSTRQERSSCNAPRNLDPPRIVRSGRRGYKCVPGRWDPRHGVAFAYRWRIDGNWYYVKYPRLYTNAFLATRALGVGVVLRCQVMATSRLGTDVAFSEPLITRFLHIRLVP
jgi:hypothetical protein